MNESEDSRSGLDAVPASVDDEKPPVTRALRAGAKSAERVARATGVDRIVDEAVDDAVVQARSPRAGLRAQSVTEPIRVYLKSGWVPADQGNMDSGDALPDRAGPVPDRLTIWPMDDGRYGLDATFQGASGYQRADHHREALDRSGVRYRLNQELGGGWTLRFGPLRAVDVATALGAFVY